MIVDKWNECISDILSTAKFFIEESNYDIDYDPEGALEYMWRWFNDPNTAIFVNYQNDKFAGGVICTKSKECHKQYFGYIVKFYVLPTARGTTCGRELMQEATEWFDKNQCVHTFVTSTAQIGEDQLFINLMQKYGYSPVGKSLMRKLHG